MTDADPAAEFPADFTGMVRLFPLPNLVMFPHAMQPLRIFEPRYRALMEEALAADRLITMGMLLPGWEKAYFKRPPIAPVVCIGRVMAHSLEPNGDYNLLLLGMRRAEIQEEVSDATRPFRRAHVRLLEDRYSPLNAHERPQLQQTLLEYLGQFLPAGSDLRKHYDQTLGTNTPLGPLTDILAFSVGLEPALKQQLLAEVDVDRRARMLLDSLESVTRPRDFPPDFSAN